MLTYGTTPYNLVPSSLQPIQPHALHLKKSKNSAGDAARKEPTAKKAKPTYFVLRASHRLSFTGKVR